MEGGLDGKHERKKYKGKERWKKERDIKWVHNITYNIFIGAI